MKVAFNKPYLTGNELKYIEEAVSTAKISGNGVFTKKCQTFLERLIGAEKVLLTSSCTDALEMCALLIDIRPGDEVIIPSYTFVSTANAFILRGAKVIFADSLPHHPNLDTSALESLITPKTKAIVPVHYAGVACNMDEIMEVAGRHNLWVIEDAAQAIDSYYNGKHLGAIGHLSTFSFHETKNIIAGEGGALAINDKRFIARAEIIWEKGTNRAAFWRGEIDKYNWVDVGSSFLPSEIVAAFLLAQLECLSAIQKQRITKWETYAKRISKLNTDLFYLPEIPSYATNNGHLFSLVCKDAATRSRLIEFLNARGVNAVFHYLSLHKSPFYQDKFEGELPYADHFSDTLVRLPLFYGLTETEQEYVCRSIEEFVTEIEALKG